MMKNSRRSLTGLTVAVAFLAVAAGAQAQSSMSSATSGSMWPAASQSYIGLSGGRSDFELGNGIGLFNHDQNDNAYSINAGTYPFNNFGFEVGYTDFGQIDRAGGRTQADGINLSLIGRLPLGTSFNLLGKLGTTYGRTDVSSDPSSGVGAGTESGFGWSYGVGAEFTFSPQWSAVLQYDEHRLKYVGGHRDSLSTTTLGARYRF